ncbi:hypothetical protein BGX29_003751 [Mortierella sp. GBA35]|nr:hypothetical protein BGX29_003751 [Mortierella sp. GBA35]
MPTANNPRRSTDVIGSAAAPSVDGSGSGAASSSSSSSSASVLVSSLNMKYESVVKGNINNNNNGPSQNLDHSEDLTMPLVFLALAHHQQQQQQQQTHWAGVTNGSGPSSRSMQHPSTSSAAATANGSTFLQSNAEMDTFSETHSGVIMAYPTNPSSSSAQANTSTANGPGCLGLGDFLRSLVSQSLVSRLYSHRPQLFGIGTPSWSIMRTFHTCHLLYLIPVTTITIERLVFIDMICNEQLYNWLTVQAFLFLLQIMSTCNIHQRQAMSTRINVMDQRARIVLHVIMVWTVIGVGFLGPKNTNSQDPCSATNDPIYSLSFKIIIFHVTRIGFYFLPCSSLLLTRVLPNLTSSGLTRTATKPMIDKLGSTPMVEGMFGGDTEEATCAICLGDYTPGETIRLLPCQHHFHLECVDQWLATDKSW